MEATIVHISDLHFKDDVENRKRLQYFLEDIARLKPSGPIFTAFTGDLVQSADKIGEYDRLFEQLISPLIGLGHEVMTVPGNHDIQRSLTGPDFTNTFLKDTTSSYLFSPQSTIRSPLDISGMDPLERYMQLEELLGPYDQRTYYGYCRNRGSISFVGMNSSWLSRKREEHESDRGQLRIEPYIVDQLTLALPAENLKIGLMHHPLDWLEEGTRAAVSDLLTKHFDAVLFGHVHSRDVLSIAKEDAGCLYLQSPPLRAQWSKGTNGYSIIRTSIKEKKFEVEYRSYSASRRQFVVGEDYAQGGKFYPRSEDRQFFLEKPSEDALIMRYADSTSFDYTAWYRENIRAKSKYSGDFADPKVRLLPSNPEDVWLQASEHLSEVVVKSLRHQIFIAPPDSGLTTAAFISFKRLSEEARDTGRIPAFFDAKEHKIDRASILREISRTLLVRYTHQEIEALARKGLLSIVVDGLSLSAPDQFNLFRDTMARYFPDVRTLIFVSTERRGPVAVGSHGPQLNPEEDEVYDFVELNVADIRKMVAVRKIGIEETLVNGMVSQVVESFRQMDEPIFASSVSVLVDTLSQDPDFKPLNKARLLERYVECLLGRFNLEDVQEGVFASSDKIDLLSYIARSMLESDFYGVDEQTWNQLVTRYSELYFIDLPVGLLDEFIAKGILTVFGGKITFRGDYLFSFFVARQMKADPVFSAEVTSGESLFRFHKEIAFYGDLEGTDTRSVLNALYTAVESLQAVLEDTYSESGIDLSKEWINSCQEQYQTEQLESDLERATNDLAGADPTPENADHFDDHELSRVHRRRGVAERVDVMEAEARLLVSIRLYALLLKNSLQVPGPEKMNHLKKLYEAAEIWVGFLCANRADIVSKPIVLAGGVRIINMGALFDPERSAREFKYNAPNSLSKILSDSLRNPQLSTTLRRLIPSLSPMGGLFARDVLLELPSEENRKAYFASLSQETDSNIITASLKTLRNRFLASGRSKDHRENFEMILGMLQKHKPAAGKLNYERLKRDRLLRDMRDNAKNLREGG